MLASDQIYDFFNENSFPEEDLVWSKFQNNESFLVHYTNAEAARKIIENKQIWLTHVRNTNDTTEIDYGIKLFFDVFEYYVEKYRQLIKEIDPKDGWEDFRGSFIQDINNARENSFIVCFSDHNLEQLDGEYFGELAMWQRYGSGDPVCIVLNSQHFIEMSGDVDNAPLIQIRYKDGSVYLNNEFERFFDVCYNNIDLIKKNPRQSIEYIVHKLKTDLLSLKHPSFSDEREFRVLYSPKFPSNIVNGPETIFLRDKLRSICNIPLDEMPSNARINYKVENIISKIVIGPSPRKQKNAELFVSLLKKIGIKNPEDRVVVTNIPFRTET